MTAPGRPRRPSPILPALALFGPLLLLAWLGHGELSRQSDLAQQALRQEAVTFCQTAAEVLEDQVRRAATELLDGPLVVDGDEPLVRRAAALIRDERLVLGLFIVDASADLVWPRPDAASGTGFPMAAAPRSRLLAAAEVLEQLGDVAGARDLVVAYLERETTRHPLDRPRACLQMGRLLRAAGAPDEAGDWFVSARYAAEQLRLAGDAAGVRGIELLAAAAVARSEGLPGPRLGLGTEIADGRTWADVDDRLASGVLHWLVADLDGDARPQAIGLLRLDEVRRAARRFASEYGAFSAEACRRVLQHLRNGRHQLVVHGSGVETSLLAIRACSPEERMQLGGGAYGIGLQLRLASLVNDSLDGFLARADRDHVLTVLDPNGSIVLGEVPAAPAAGGGGILGEAPELTTVAGLRLRATPVAPERMLARERATARNRILLLAVLLLLAAGGAFLLFRAARRESALAALKVDFVSRIGHELKTPLALIKVYGETIALGRARESDEARRFGGIITREADRLTGMIERVLTFSRQDAGTLDYRPARLRLDELVAEVTDAYRPRLSARGGTLRTQVQPAWVEVDRDAMEDALLNLLENADKYSADPVRDGRGADAPGSAAAASGPAASLPAAAGPTVDVELRCERDTVVLEVADRGVGIPTDEREQVFESFYRASTAGERRGAGLGLNLVAHFVAAHGGRVEALGRDGGGTVVRITLARSDGDG